MPVVSAGRKKRQIAESGSTIYDAINAELFYDVAELEALILETMQGAHLPGPARTRSPAAKSLVCASLGYTKPKSFTRTKPRFPSQHLDVYVQKSDNLQIYNVAEIDPTQRFVLIRVDADDIVRAVRAVEGTTVAVWDTTGTLTSKYQARRRRGATGDRLVSERDTSEFEMAFRPVRSLPAKILAVQSPTSAPTPQEVLSISGLYNILEPALRGRTLSHLGYDQERNRGAGFHRLVCEILGLAAYADLGQFPDIRCQALELKFHLAPTIDLGRGLPDSDHPALALGQGLTHRDTRYLVAYGELTHGTGTIEITDVVLSTGADFFEEFELMGGLGQNTKLQIPLPRDLFGI